MIFQKFIHKFREKDWLSLRGFVAKHFYKNYILTNKKFFDWQYSSATLVLSSDNKILGYLGLIPLKMNCFGREIKCACLANLMIDKSLRNKGAGVDLIQAAALGYELLYNLGYNQAMSNLYRHLEWRSDIFLKRFVLILKKIRTPESSSEFSLMKYSKFDDRVDAFWENIRYKYPITISRSKKYFNWRYANHPIFKYDIFFTEKYSEIKAIIVARVEKSGEYKIARIMDFISRDEAEEFTLQKTTEFYSKRGIYLLDFFFTGDFHVESLKRCGFVEAKKPPHSLVPSLFNPLVKNPKPINFAFKLTNTNLYSKKAYDIINNWYVTKGDGDQDRPNPK